MTNVILGFLPLAAAIFVPVVFWVIALYGAITRTDLKESRWLWIALLLLVGPVGMVVYFFVENRKRLGIATLVILFLFLVLLPIFAIVSFRSAQSKAEERARQMEIIRQNRLQNGSSDFIPSTTK